MQQRDRLGTPDPTRGLVRVVRGVAVGGSALAVSLAGHLIGRAAMPSPTMLAGLLVPAAVVAWALSGARWTLLSLTGVLVAAQSVLHLSFTVSAGDAASHQVWPMLLGHAAATLVMVGVLHRGEELLWSVAESLGLRVWRLLRAAVPPVRSTVPVPVVHVRTAMPRCWHGSEPPRRGPPLGSRALRVSA